MSSPDIRQSMPETTRLKAVVINAGMAAVNRYLEDPTAYPPVERDPDYIKADRTYTLAMRAQGPLLADPEDK